MTIELSTPTRIPGGIPLLGHARQFARFPLEFVTGQYDRGEVVQFQLGPAPAYLLTSPQAVHDLLRTHHNASRNGVLFERLKILGGNGLGSLFGKSHRARRQMIMPLFARSRIDDYARVMSEVAVDISDSWQDGQRLALDVELHTLTATILVRTLFSSDLSRDAAEQAAAHLRVVFAGVARRAYAPTDLLFRLPTSANREFNVAVRSLHDLVDRIIATYRNETAERGNMLSMLLAARDPETGEQLTDDQVHDDVMTAFFVGTEASAAALAWTFHLLDRHPEVAARVRYEVDEVLAGRPARIDDLPRLTYLRQVADETLRLYPPGWLFPRIPLEEIAVAGYRIPRGANVFFSPYTLHHDDRSYPDPEVFDPDRWNPDRTAEIPPYGYIPFGLGQRSCVGDSMAMTALLIVVATLMSRWEFHGVAGAEVAPVAATVLHPDQLPMVVELR
jgi:pentalenene oxygenase